MKIFIGLTEVSGYYSNLKAGFSELGVHAEHVSLQTHPFDYGDDVSKKLIPSIARFCVIKRLSQAQRSVVHRFFWLITTLSSRLLLFVWALHRFDVFIMGGGSSFFNYYEFPLLRFFKKKIIYIFHGTDLRPPYIDGIRELSFSERINQTRCSQKPLNSNNTKELTNQVGLDYSYFMRMSRMRKWKAAWVEKYSNIVIALPTVGHFLTKPFVQWLIVGSPLHFEFKRSRDLPSKKYCATTILHCPSHLSAKGTYKIREAVDALKKKGYAINYVELSGRPNREVLEAIDRCDFVVDQVYSDVPMAAFATEAAFLGKPAVVGGYYSDMIHRELRNEWIAPSLFCHPDNLKTSIEQLIVDKNYCEILGSKAKEFVENKWTAKKVAARYIRLINNEIPADWWFDPMQISYVYGMGLSKKKASFIIKEIIDKYGKEALLLENKPELEKQFIEFAASKTP